MLGTIAFVTIFSSILVFFADELLAYAKKLVARPYGFLVFSLILSSAFLEMYEQKLLLALISVWIGLLLIVQWLTHHLWFLPMANVLAKFMVVLVLSSIPLCISYLLEKKYKKRYFNAPKKNHHRGYILVLFVWVIVILLFALGPPGSDFSG